MWKSDNIWSVSLLNQPETRPARHTDIETDRYSDRQIEKKTIFVLSVYSTNSLVVKVKGGP